MDDRDALLFANTLARPPLPSGRPERQPLPPSLPKTSYWPGQSDLELSKKYDTFYGSPHAAYMNPNNAVVKTSPIDNIIAWRKQIASGVDEGPRVNYNINTQRDADRLRAQGIAAERSALAKLGWDPGLSTSTPPGQTRLNLNGMYNSTSNVDWHDQDLPNAAIHEAMHRGFRRLFNENKAPKGFNWNDEEAYVRALMQKAYGNIEVEQDRAARNATPDPNSAGYKQVLQGAALRDSMMADMIEKAAAEEIARKRPRGPR